MGKPLTTRVAQLEQIFGGIDGVQTPEATVTALTNSMADKTTDGTLEALGGTYTKAEIERNLSELNVLL